MVPIVTSFKGESIYYKKKKKAIEITSGLEKNSNHQGPMLCHSYSYLIADRSVLDKHPDLMKDYSSREEPKEGWTVI